MKKILFLLVVLISQTQAQLPCYQLKYFDNNAAQVVYTTLLPTPWWAILMSPPDCGVKVDSAYFMFGVQRDVPSQRPDTIQIRIIDSKLPNIVIIDSLSLRVSPNLSGHFNPAYYIAEFYLSGLSPLPLIPVRNFYLSWRIKGATGDFALIYFRQPAIEPQRSVVINTNGTTTPVSQIIRYQIPDSADLWAESRVCCTLNTPVQLASFSAVYQGGASCLRWITATEENNYGFDIERLVAHSSTMNFKIWEKIGFAPGYGTTNDEHTYTFRDPDPEAYIDDEGFVTYRITQIDFDGAKSNYQAQRVLIPSKRELITLQQNFPNPVSMSTQSTSITFSLAGAAHVRLDVYDALGRNVATLFDENREAGEYTIPVHTGDLHPGTYFYSLRSGVDIRTNVLTIVE